MTYDPAYYLAYRLRNLRGKLAATCDGKLAATCYGIAIRDGEQDVCGKPAVSVACNAEDGEWYPVCAHHTRKDWAVPLTDVLAFAWHLSDDARPSPWGAS